MSTPQKPCSSMHSCFDKAGLHSASNRLRQPCPHRVEVWLLSIYLRIKQNLVKRSKKTANPKRIAPWVWFLNLGLAVVFVYFLYLLKTVPETAESPGISAIDTETPGKSEATRDSTSPVQDFTFYELLQESEITAPEVEEYQPKKLPENVSFLLQTGSFRRFTDAERQRANIAFQGLKAEVKKITLADQKVWFRVQVGPYRSRSKMNSAIDRLVAINIQPLVRKQVLD